MLDRPIKKFFQRTVKNGSLEVTYPTGEVCQYGNGQGTPLAVKFMDHGAIRAFYINPALRIGEMHMDGRIVITRGTLYEYITLLKRNAFRKHMPLTSKIMAGLYHVASLIKNQWRAGTERRYVAHHYDLDGKLYRLFLDDDWQYSCAYFEREDMTLEEAQLAKKRLVAAKLLAEPGQKILELGCGWGGLGLYLAEMTGAHVTGVTLSSEQADVAQRRTINRGLEGKAEFHLKNYRDMEGTYDRVISIGMLEHVGRENYEIVFNKAASLLSDDGVAVFHAIGRPKPALAQIPFNEKYIFPGGYIPSVSQIYPAIEASGLIVRDLEILPMHYARTCRIWRERFMENWDAAAELFDERFCRMWELYLAGSESAFAHDRLMIFQFQLSKPGSTATFGRAEIKKRQADLEAREKTQMTKDVIEL